MALTALCLWVVAAWLLQIVLTAPQSWPAAYALAAVGAPLLGWLWLDLGPIWAAGGLAVMALVLRWPLRYLGRWLTGIVRAGGSRG